MVAPTIKKKPTLKIKSKAEAVAPAAETPEGDGPAVPVAAPVAEMPVASSPHYTTFAMLGLAAVIMFIALLVLQWVEWSDLSPSFPKRIEIGAAVPPAVTE